MNFRFRHSEPQLLEPQQAVAPSHQITSAFDTSICRFTLTCTCGEHFDTRYIDEALEYRELHQSLAPLTDQMAD